MAVTCEVKDGIQVARITNPELSDESLILEIGNKLQGYIDKNESGHFLLDMAEVTYLSSLMVGQLMSFKKACGLKQIDFKICGIKPAIRELLELVRVDKLIRLYETEQEALESIEDSEPDTVVNFADDVSVSELTEKSVLGDATAQWELAKCYEEGNGIDASASEALKWYEASALQDHTEAQYKLGMAYAYGIDVEQDFQRALPWYRLAAKKGHRDAQYMLALAFDHELAGITDKDLAKKWYEKAASQGHEKAIEALENLGGV